MSKNVEDVIYLNAVVVKLHQAVKLTYIKTIHQIINTRDITKPANQTPISSKRTLMISKTNQLRSGSRIHFHQMVKLCQHQHSLRSFLMTYIKLVSFATRFKILTRSGFESSVKYVISSENVEVQL